MRRSYAAYQGMRPTLAYLRGATWRRRRSCLRVALPGGRQYALAPELAPLLPLFNAGRLGVMLNVGTLVQPTTKAQYTAKSVPLPPKLFSHNDQQSVWQSSAPEGATSGWGGRMGDLFVAGNGNATFTCVNVSGNAVFLSGSTRGAVPGLVVADRSPSAAWQGAAVRLDRLLERAAARSSRRRARTCSRTSTPASRRARSTPAPALTAALATRAGDRDAVSDRQPRSPTS